MGLDWRREEGRVTAGAEGRLVFTDSAEHWDQGVLRLMQWSPDQGRAFVEASVAKAGGPGPWLGAGAAGRIRALAAAANEAWPEPPAAKDWAPQALLGFHALGVPLDRFWTRALAGDASLAMAGSSRLEHGLLLRRQEDGPVAVAEAPAYEEAYFEGGQGGYGYGQLEAQSDWRLEKGRRQVGQLQAFLEQGRALPSGRAVRFLDVGSGYGYLRQGAQEAGWQHEGLELSRHACAAARRFFGFDSFQGTLDRHPGRGFDVLAMMDLIEHVADPVALLLQAAERLVPGGLCVVRTPNLMAVEREVFGHRYHSFKAEHLHCFSPRSLKAAFRAAGFEPLAVSTEAHLLQGFLGPEAQVLAGEGRGSDILAAGQKKRSA